MIEGVFACEDGSRILWSSSLASTALTHSPELHGPLQSLLRRRGRPANTVQEQLLQILGRQGYLRHSKHSIRPPSKLWRVWERFDYAAMAREAAATRPCIHAFLGDGQGLSWVYATRPGLDPCLDCLVRRWLANSFLGDAVRELCKPGRSVFWANHLDSKELDPLQPTWGEVLYRRAPDACWESWPVLPVPVCLRCRHLQPERRPDSAYHPLWGLIPRENSWPLDGENFWLRSCTSGEGWWLTGDRGYPGGSGASRESPERARERALGEAIERYCASHCPPDLDSKDALLFGSGSLSHGLACGRTLEEAQQGAWREKVERDAIAIFWGRLSLGMQTGAVSCLTSWCPEGLEARLFRLPSAVDSAYLAILRDSEGRLACGTAILDSEKALEEAFHNVQFLRLRGSDLAFQAEPRSFEEHLVSYWHRPQLFPWERLTALPQGDCPSLAPLEGVEFRELTTCDAAILGLRVVRARLPKATFLPASHSEWPTHLLRWKECVGPDSPPFPHPFG